MATNSKLIKLSPDKRKRLLSGRKSGVMIYPLLIEKKYEKALTRLMDSFAADIRIRIIAALPDLEDEFKFDMDIRSDAASEVRMDDFTKLLNRIVNGILVTFGDRLEKFENEIEKVGKDTNKWNKDQTNRLIKDSLGVDILSSDKEMDAAIDLWVRDNLRAISSLASTESKRIEQILVDGFRNGLRHEVVAKGILDTFRSSENRMTEQAKGMSIENRAKFIARDQIGKLNAQVTRTRQTRLGIGRYIWRHSRDERVRGNPNGKYPNVPADENHWKREGQIFYWNPKDGKIPEDGHPGMSPNCRCWAEPVLDDLFIDDE